MYVIADRQLDVAVNPGSSVKRPVAAWREPMLKHGAPALPRTTGSSTEIDSPVTASTPVTVTCARSAKSHSRLAAIVSSRVSCTT